MFFLGFLHPVSIFLQRVSIHVCRAGDAFAGMILEGLIDIANEPVQVNIDEREQGDQEILGNHGFIVCCQQHQQGTADQHVQQGIPDR